MKQEIKDFRYVFMGLMFGKLGSDLEEEAQKNINTIFLILNRLNEAKFLSEATIAI